MFERFMKRTDWYYQEQLYDTSYSTDPSGAELDIDRLVNGAAAYWKTQTRCPTTLHKKKLVITDWRNTKREYFFGGLMDEGFELYVCQGTAIKLTSKNELRAVLANLVKVNPTPKKDVIQIMANQGVPADHVLVLDYFLMNQLELTDIQEPLHIIDFDYSIDKNDGFFDSLLNSIEGIRIGIQVFDKNDIIERYLNQFLKKSNHISYLVSDIDYFESLFTSIPSLAQTLESLKICTTSNPLNTKFIKELINLRELDLGSSSIIAKSLKSLLVSCPHLEKLVLNNCKNINDSSEEFFLDENLRELKDLYLGYSSITMKFLNNLLAHCPNLEKLDLMYCKNINDSSEKLQFSNLEKLKELNLSFLSINLNSLFAHCPNLVSLKLGIINSGGEELQFSNLEKLKELELSGSITTKFFNSLLAHCPNLEKLNLNLSEIINDSNEEIQFENLKNLKGLESVNLSIKFLNSLPAHCLNLIKLSLRSCQNINDSSEELQLNVNLKELYLMFSSMKSLNRVLACYPNLVKIDLSYCNHINDINEAFQLNKELKELKKLNFSRSAITTTSLIRLLVYCPNLETLDLSSCLGVKIDDPVLKKALANIKNVILPNLPSINSSSYETTSTSTGPRADMITTPLSSRYRLDKNTKYNQNTVLDVNQYFLPKSKRQPDPSTYRLQVFNHIELKENGEICLVKARTATFEKRTFEITSIHEIQKVYDQHYENKPDYFYGQISLSLAQGEKYALPSLSTIDEIKSLSANVPVDLWYCEAENLYYVSLQDGYANQNATIGYIVHIPSEMTPPFPKHIQQLIDFYHFEHPTMGAGELEGIDDNSSDTEILNAIKKQRKGSCRHRTLALMADIEKMSTTEKNGVEVRAVFNGCHAFLEIKIPSVKWYQSFLLPWIGTSFGKSKFYKVDFGGYEATLNIKPIEKLENKNTSKQNEKTGQSQQENPFNHQDHLPPDTVQSFDDYCPWLLNQANTLLPQKRNVLIKYDNTEQLENFNIAMLRHLVEEKKQYYYLNSLDDVTRKDIAFSDSDETDTYQIIDSNLISYLKQAKAGDVLIVNWSPNDPVGYNTLIDKERKLDAIPIPEGVVIIGLLELSKAKSMREDFYRRFGIKINFPHLNNDNSNPNIAKINSVDFPVDMYGEEDLERYLLGNVSIQGEKLALQKGALIQALETNCDQLIIQNGPQHLRMFRLFCEEVLCKRSFTFHGKTYTLPENFTFKYETKPHDLSSGYSMTSHQENAQWDYPLNIKTLSNFFTTYQCEDHHLYQRDGWLAQHTNNCIRVLVTENLRESQWEKLLDKAKAHHCQLEIITASDIVLPPAMEDTRLPNENPARFPLLPLDINQQPKQQIAVVVSQDMDLTAEEMATDHSAEILSVTQKMSFADLIEGITRDNNPDEPHFRFKSTHGALLEKLQQGNVILKGTLSADLRAKLETLFCSEPYLWVNGEKEYFKNIKGRLIIVTEDDKTFPLAPRYQHKVTKADRWQALKTKFDARLIDKLTQQMAGKNDDYSYSQLTAMLQQLQKNEGKNVFKPFQRLDSNPETSELKKRVQEDVDQKRLAKINRYLAYSPYVFIVGPSGVGKSSFIKNMLKEQANVFVGLDHVNLSRWAQPITENKKNILFIDEANLEADGSFDIFEGLFCNPPGIVINEKFCPLTNDHKIIFAGNYNNFSGRQHHKFFKKHGAVMSFKEFADDYLSSKIIIPVLNNALNGTVPPLSEEQLQEAIKIFLKAYHIVNQSLPKPKLTARNLQMMCLRFALYQQQNKRNKNISTIAGMAVYDEIAYLSLDEQTQNELEQACHVSQPTATTKNYAFNQFIVTESRKNSLRLLGDHFAIRELKIKNNIIAGISGFLLEGPSGIGKSEMVIEYLRAKGYQNGFEANTDADSTHRYYHITPTNPLILEILVKAFHEGAVVIIDEFNTLAIEKILNSLLSEGTDPQGQKPKEEGFFIIATQNPISFEGRQNLSDPLEKRIQRIVLPDYPNNELIEILITKGVQKKEAINLVNYYYDNRKQAASCQNAPITPSHLFSYAESMVNEISAGSSSKRTA
jgi:hypothetical protein